MAYARGNPKTKKELKARVASGVEVRVFSPGPFPVQSVGLVSVEGPHFPAPHTWYAQVQVSNGIIVKVVK